MENKIMNIEKDRQRERERATQFEKYYINNRKQ